MSSKMNFKQTNTVQTDHFNGNKFAGRNFSSKKDTQSKSSHSDDSGPILFPCIECGYRLQTKQLPDGTVVKKWDDNTCELCWQADDMVHNPSKYGLTPQIVEFLNCLELREVALVVKPTRLTDSQRMANTFLSEELIFELYYSNSDHDWQSDIDSLSRMLEGPEFYTRFGQPKNKTHLMELVYKRVVKP